MLDSCICPIPTSRGVGKMERIGSGRTERGGTRLLGLRGPCVAALRARMQCDLAAPTAPPPVLPLRGACTSPRTLGPFTLLATLPRDVDLDLSSRRHMEHSARYRNPCFGTGGCRRGAGDHLDGRKEDSEGRAAKEAGMTIRTRFPSAACVFVRYGQVSIRALYMVSP
ncbi:hypothetical protein MSAN_01752600 [Mycena sanguinolenta]|uniref:Uncharacterized protein n=1 Tax=Mycena sanguinolenta TaxID=230812 RepID=A0A8H6XXD7_9AGAR|nr:hypothetical protein MSAN_01752600 [Mycena sanguinolenta]